MHKVTWVACAARAAPDSRKMGHDGPRGDFRFSDRVFGRAAVALAIVAVHTARQDNVRAVCTAAAMDSEGRF